MKRYFSVTTAQHAPMPRTARHACVWLSGTHHTALTKAHCAKFHSARRMSNAITTVTVADGHEANRFVRTQPTQPGRRGGPCGTASGTPATAVSSASFEAASLMLTTHQRGARVVPVHQQADAQADGQENQHDHRDAFDRLAGLVEHGVGDRDDVLIADGDRER